MATHRKDSSNIPEPNAAHHSCACPDQDEMSSAVKAAGMVYTGETLPVPHVAECTLYPRRRSLLSIMAVLQVKRYA